MAREKDIDTLANGRVVSVEELQKLLSGYDCGISYKAMGTEPDPTLLFPFVQSKFVYTIQPIASLDPAVEAQYSQEAVANAEEVSAVDTAVAGTRTAKTFILVPGRKFDATGTRHGKGGGWYDRYLSVVPREWLRVGMCAPEHFSKEVLAREHWDEEMDLVCVVF